MLAALRHTLATVAARLAARGIHGRISTRTVVAAFDGVERAIVTVKLAHATRQDDAYARVVIAEALRAAAVPFSGVLAG